MGRPSVMSFFRELKERQRLEHTRDGADTSAAAGVDTGEGDSRDIARRGLEDLGGIEAEERDAGRSHACRPVTYADV